MLEPGLHRFVVLVTYFNMVFFSEALASVLSKLVDLNPTLFIKCFFPNLYVQVCVYSYTRLNSDQSLARVRNW